MSEDEEMADYDSEDEGVMEILGFNRHDNTYSVLSLHGEPASMTRQ